MKNQRGEVVTGVIIVLMVGMMLFGMVFMMRNNEDRRQDRGNVEHKQESAEKRDQNTREVHNAAEQASMSATKENK